MERQDSHSNWSKALRGLVEADYEAFKIEAGNVLDLTTHPGWTFLQRMIDGRIQKLTDQIEAEGEPPSQARYARWVGEIVGLRKIREAADTVLFVAEQEDEERGDNPARLAAV